MRGASGLAALAVAVAISACGTAGGAHRFEGQTLFTQNCGVCHSLSGRQSPLRQGGDLLDLHVRRAEMLQFVREMPTRRRLSRAQLGIVAGYVLAVERRRVRPG
jgi:mono/diheme cytochrome c family protein